MQPGDSAVYRNQRYEELSQFFLPHTDTEKISKSDQL